MSLSKTKSARLAGLYLQAAADYAREHGVSPQHALKLITDDVLDAAAAIKLARDALNTLNDNINNAITYMETHGQDNP